MENFPHRKLTEQIIGAAIEVHKTLGPGLLESAYEQCLCHKLGLRGLSLLQQVPIGVRYSIAPFSAVTARTSLSRGRCCSN